MLFRFHGPVTKTAVTESVGMVLSLDPVVSLFLCSVSGIKIMASGIFASQLAHKGKVQSNGCMMLVVAPLTSVPPRAAPQGLVTILGSGGPSNCVGEMVFCLLCDGASYSCDI